MATRDGELFKETIQVSLDGRQIFCLFAGGAVIASLVFVLGVMVGRRVEARSHPERAGAGETRDPLAALDRIAGQDGAADQELAFASALRGDKGDQPLGAVDVSLERGQARSDAPSLAGGGEGDDSASGKSGEASDTAKSAAAKAAAAKSDASPTKSDDKAAGDDSHKAAAAATAPAEVAPDQARFTLQINSFQSQAEAQAFERTLGVAGYAPYVITAEVDDKDSGQAKGTWYRVRIGHYRDYDDAIAAKKTFEKSQKIIAYVTRIH